MCLAAWSFNKNTDVRYTAYKCMWHCYWLGIFLPFEIFTQITYNIQEKIMVRVRSNWLRTTPWGCIREWITLNLQNILHDLSCVILKKSVWETLKETATYSTESLLFCHKLILCPWNWCNFYTNNDACKGHTICTNFEEYIFCTKSSVFVVVGSRHVPSNFSACVSWNQRWNVDKMNI